MLCPRGATKTIVLKSPDSDKVREVIVTSVLLPKSENGSNRTPVKCYSSSEESLGMEKRVFKRRLDHLTLEEKILRKKLKNREAAQTSRDKKKARLEELEATVVQLQNENESLHEEVLSLRDERESLQRENSRLTEEVWRLSVASEPSGPAVSCPLPKGARPPPALLPHPLKQRLLSILTMLSLSLTKTGAGSMTSLSHLLSKNWNDSQARSLLKLMILKNQKQRKKMWWGRKQKAWNPVGPALKIAKRT